jgi:hypothetical protein
LVFLFASLVLLLTALGGDWPVLGQFASFALTAFGFWFVPELLDLPTRWEAMRAAKQRMREILPQLVMPSAAPDFKAGSWSAVDSARLKLEELTK